MQCVICTTLFDDSPKHHHSSHHTYSPGLVSKGSDDDQQEGLRCSDKELDKNGNMFCNCISVCAHCSSGLWVFYILFVDYICCKNLHKQNINSRKRDFNNVYKSLHIFPMCMNTLYSWFLHDVIMSKINSNTERAIHQSETAKKLTGKYNWQDHWNMKNN